MSHPNPSGQPQQHYHQFNTPASGGTVYSNQGPGNQIFYQTYVDPAAQRRRRLARWGLLGALVTDVLYFFYGMWSYTGRNTPGDAWRAGIYLVMLAVTIRLLRGWLRTRR